MQKQKEKELLDLMIKNHKENELLIKKQKEQDQLYLRHPLNRGQKQLLYPNQIQQQKNMIPKTQVTSNIPQNINQNNIFDEIPKIPRDSKRSKKNMNIPEQNNLNNNHLPKVESGSSYQLLEKGLINLNEGMNTNYNNMEFLSNTNYNINSPNLNDIGYNQQYSLFNNENNNIEYKY